MKILQKRIYAVVIDSMILGLYYEVVRHLIYDWISILGSIGFAILLSPFFFRDLVFRNASIGKKIMGISVFDSKWEKPKVSVIVKRDFWISIVSYGLLFKSMFSNGDYISIFDYEREKIGSAVIDDKIYEDLKKKAEKQNGDYAENMTKLYNEYLRSIYMK